MITLFVLIATGVSSMWVFDYIVYSVRSAPKAASFNHFFWFSGAVILAICIGFWMGVLTP